MIEVSGIIKLFLFILKRDTSLLNDIDSVKRFLGFFDLFIRLRQIKEIVFILDHLVDMLIS